MTCVNSGNSAPNGSDPPMVTLLGIQESPVIKQNARHVLRQLRGHECGRYDYTPLNRRSVRQITGSSNFRLKHMTSTRTESQLTGRNISGTNHIYAISNRRPLGRKNWFVRYKSAINQTHLAILQAYMDPITNMINYHALPYRPHCRFCHYGLPDHGDLGNSLNSPNSRFGTMYSRCSSVKPW
jgi:hypothetical protein